MSQSLLKSGLSVQESSVIKYSKLFFMSQSLLKSGLSVPGGIMITRENLKGLNPFLNQVFPYELMRHTIKKQLDVSIPS